MNNEKLSPLEALKKIMSFVDIYKGNYDKETHLCNPEILGLEGIIEMALQEKEIPTETFEQFVGEPSEIIYKKLKALEIIKSCLVSEFKLFEKDGEYLILFYFDEIHELTFRLKNKEEYDLLKEVLL